MVVLGFLNPIFFIFFWGGLGHFFFDISSSWVKRSFHADFELSRLPGSCSSMVGDKQKTTTNLVKLEASLASAEADVGAVAKADQ